MRAFRCFVLLPGLAACGHLVDPPLPAGAEPFAPPPVFATWWAVTEACAGLQAPMAAVRWYVVPGATAVHTAGVSDAAGYWSAAGHQIVLAEAVVRDGGEVRHEMLHALTRRAGHARADFLERCGGTVDCGAACVQEAGPPPAPASSTARVEPSALEVGVAVVPAQPGAAQDGGHFALIVSVRNPAAYPVELRFPPHPGGGVPRSFGFRLVGPAGGVQGGELALDAGLAYFRRGESKRHVFDLVVGSALAGRTVPPGTYRVDGEFAGQQATLAAVTLGP